MKLAFFANCPWSDSFVKLTTLGSREAARFCLGSLGLKMGKGPSVTWGWTLPRNIACQVGTWKLGKLETPPTPQRMMDVWVGFSLVPPPPLCIEP